MFRYHRQQPFSSRGFYKGLPVGDGTVAWVVLKWWVRTGEERWGGHTRTSANAQSLKTREHVWVQEMGAISSVKGCKLQREKGEISRVQTKRHLCSHACNPDVVMKRQRMERRGPSSKRCLVEERVLFQRRLYSLGTTAKQGRTRRLILLIDIKRKPGPKLLRWHSKRRDETNQGRIRSQNLLILERWG